jgi:H/ACA ribonucleoprotein complex subunit 4
MAEEENWVLDPSAKTNPAHGCNPYDRSLGELLECGVIIIDKPPGPTSHQLTAWARNLLGIARIGHGGTLDPFATGLLTLLCGRATRLTAVLLQKPKRYIAVLRFKDEVDKDRISGLLDSLTGETHNVPPKESAVKVQVRTRVIRLAQLVDVDDASRVFIVSFHCDAGTYVRTLAKDIGLLMGTGCELLELHREGTGGFDDSMACTMQQLTDAAFLWREHDEDRGLARILVPVESILDDLPRIVVKDGAVAALSHGAPLARPGVVSAPKGLPVGSSALISSLKGEVVALATLSVATDSLPGMKTGQVATSQTVMMPSGVYPQTWQTWTKEQS